MTNLKTKIKVMQAALDGKEIEYRFKHDDTWAGYLGTEHVWNWNEVDYRIKEEPMEFWMIKYDWGVTSSTWGTQEMAEAHAKDMVEAGETFRLFKVREVK